ncbi:nitrilotriacetate monooxygenase component B [Klebsiella variicola]|uniref:Nitrilotriacetate monooxygenase component B n=1 Tax=Klebsiella variicola TaxID=244366 RepID=A0A7H4MGB0_KLEVA|nr:nitrilotriacetate monooxygenase component B [Klebsiella variicola]
MSAVCRSVFNSPPPTVTLFDTWLVLGEVVAVHIDESLLDNGIYQTARAQPILRAGGPSAYYSIDDSLRFDMIRPDAR